MCNLTITFHLTKTQTSITSTTFHRLTRQDLYGTTSSGMNFIIHHMSQTLVVHRTQKQLNIQWASSVSIVKHLISMWLITKFMETTGNIFDNVGLLSKGGCIGFLSAHSCHLALQTLDQLSDGHTTGNGVWIHDDVWTDTLHGEWHVLLSIGDAHRTLLSVTTTELVTDLRNANTAHAHLHKLVAVAVGGEHHAVDNTALTAAHRRAVVLLHEARGTLSIHTVVLLLQWTGLAHDDVVTGDTCARRDQTVRVDLVVVGVPHAHHLTLSGPLEAFGTHTALALLHVTVAAVEDGAEEAAVDGRLVHDHTVFLVVATVAGDRDNRVDTGRQRTEVKVLHVARDHQRLLRVVEEMRQCVHAHLIVGDVDAHGLLAHRTLIGVTRTLVVVRERNDTATDAENHTGMNLTVRVRGAVHLGALLLHLARVRQIADGHADHHGLLLFSVHKLHQTLFE
mmetsp:Transcript_10451/g.26303  ORF Transcript_10451/g.26303 Transcript_10451/m.26303 type:complete len:451 (-) Transcript_10451:2197-3549(-)